MIKRCLFLLLVLVLCGQRVHAAVLATDDFNRANENPLAGNWATITSFTACQLSSNAVTYSDVFSDCGSRYTAGTWPNDQYSQVVLSVTTTDTGTGTGLGVAVRVASAAQTLYRVVANPNDHTWELSKFVAGSFTSLASGTSTWAVGDTMRLEAQGTTLRLYRNGTQVGSNVTDSSIASGTPGIVYSSTAINVAVDTWEGGDFTTSAVSQRRKLFFE